MNRQEARAKYDADTRISLLESDADGSDHKIDEVNERLQKLLWAGIGMLISVSTACVLLAINLVVKS